MGFSVCTGDGGSGRAEGPIIMYIGLPLRIFFRKKGGLGGGGGQAAYLGSVHLIVEI